MQQGANSLLFLTSVHFDGCNRAALLSDVALLGKIAVLGKLALLGKVAVLGKFTSWQSCRANLSSSAKMPLASSPASRWR
jgi:hypothetical protein